MRKYRSPDASPFRVEMLKAEKQITKRFLRMAGGLVRPAARQCGLHPSQLRRIVNRHRLGHLLKHEQAISGKGDL